MFRITFPAALILPLAALADEGLHHHPHGIEYGWIAAALVGFVGGGLAVAFLKGRGK